MSRLSISSDLTDHKRLMQGRLFAFCFGFLVALLIVLVAGRQKHIVYSEDIYKFAQLGRNLADGKGFSFDGVLPTMRRAPLYPALIALTYKLGATGTFPLKMIQCLFAGGICLFVFEIGRVVYNVRTAQLAATLTALHPMVFRYVPDIQVENFLAFLFALTVLVSVRFVLKPSPALGLLLGICGGLASLVKASVLFYPPVFAVVWLLILRRRKWEGKAEAASSDARLVFPASSHPLLSIAAIFCGMAIMVLPWTYRNHQTMGKTVLVSSNAGGEFLRSFVYLEPQYLLLKKGAYTDGEYNANLMEIRLFESQGKVWEKDEVENEEVVTRAAKEKLLGAPLETLWKCLRGMISYWYLVDKKANAILLLILAGLAWGFTLLGIPRAKLEKRSIWLIFTPILTVWITYALLLALGRYSSTVIPILMIPTAYGIQSLRRSTLR